MTLDGKCKEAFEKWHTGNNPDFDMSYFYKLPFSMQWGVYLDFFDSVEIEVFIHGGLRYLIYDDRKSSDEEGWENLSEEHPSRQQAQTESIKKANEIFNER